MKYNIWHIKHIKIIIMARRFIFTYSKNSNSLVIRQKGESQNGCLKKAKHAKISEKQTFLTP